MKRQNGAIGIGLIVGLCTVGILITILLVVWGIVNGNNAEAVAFETKIEAQHKDSENVLAQLSLKAVEVSGVAKAYAGDLERIVKASMQGRYGEDGSKATWQWIKEQNPNVDPALRIKVQQIIDGGRTNFEASQRVKLDTCAQYKNSLGQLFGGAVKRMMGFPKIDLKDYCEIVSSSYASDAFDTKIEKGIQGLDQ